MTKPLSTVTIPPGMDCRKPGQIAPWFVLRIYGVATTAETEGDLYESITGHRSAVLDKKEE